MNTKEAMNNMNRNTNLDLLRVLAAFLVFAVHLGNQFPWIYSYTWFGFYGTTLFFALSGYLIMGSVASCKSIKEFYLKRALRIIPLYWFVLIVIYILELIPGLISSGVSIFGNHATCGIRYLRYFAFLQMWIPSDNWDLWNNRQGLWTMSAFLFFYLVAPFIYKLFRKYYFALAVLIVMLFGHEPFVKWLESLIISQFPNVAESYSFASWTPLSVFYCFFAGVVIYLAHKEGHSIGFVLLCVAAFYFGSFQWYVWDIAMFILLIAGIEMPNLIPTNGRLMRPLQVCTGFSFALYLTHPIVMMYVARLKDYLVPIIRNKGFLAFEVLCCIGVAYLVWRFVELPLKKWGAKIAPS